MNRTRRPARALALAAALLLGPAAAAQNPDVFAEPLYGTLTLSAGFQPDPQTVAVVAGGNDRNPISGTGCVGFINAERPDVDLNYTAGSLPLLISVDSGTDTALLVNLPDGSWLCDDDGGDGSDPLLRIERPRSGNYNIWVATYSANAQANATLYVSEVSGNDADGGGGYPDVSAQPLYGTLTLSAGFQPDPQTVSLTAGGGSRNPIEGCVGNINAERPDVDLNYTAGRYPLYVYVRASYDTTLLINLPDGSWVCDDDGGDGNNPLVELGKPLSGNYNIWVGTYGSDTQPATLYVSEAAPAAK